MNQVLYKIILNDLNTTDVYLFINDNSASIFSVPSNTESIDITSMLLDGKISLHDLGPGLAGTLVAISDAHPNGVNLDVNYHNKNRDFQTALKSYFRRHLRFNYEVDTNYEIIYQNNNRLKFVARNCEKILLENPTTSVKSNKPNAKFSDSLEDTPVSFFERIDLDKTAVDIPFRLEALSQEPLMGRTWFFDKTSQYINSENPYIFMIYGNPGSGKSMIAAHIKKALSQSALPITIDMQYAFDFQSSESNNLDRLYSIIAANLSIKHPDFKSILLSKTNDPQFDFGTGKDRYRKLLVNPLKELEEKEDYFILIDALDECHGYRELLDYLTDPDLDLPRWIHFIITSRPEPSIKQLLRECRKVNSTDCINLHSEENITLVEKDLSDYYHNRLQNMLSARFSEEDIQAFYNRLVQASEGLFDYAKNICLMIEDSIESDSLGELSSYEISRGRAWLYRKTMERKTFRYYNGKESLNYQAFWQVPIGMILAASDPIPPKTFKLLMGWGDNEYHAFFAPLATVLDESNGVIQINHKTFCEWISDRDEAMEFYSSPADGRRNLVNAYFQLVEDGSIGNDAYALEHALELFPCELSKKKYEQLQLNDAFHTMIYNVAKELFVSCQHEKCESLCKKMLDIYDDTEETNCLDKYLVWSHLLFDVLCATENHHYLKRLFRAKLAKSVRVYNEKQTFTAYSDYVLSLFHMSKACSWDNDIDEATEFAQKGLSCARKLYSDAPKEMHTYCVSLLCDLLDRNAECCKEAGHLNDALSFYDESISLTKEFLQEQLTFHYWTSSDYRSKLGERLERIGDIYFDVKRISEAKTKYKEEASIWVELNRIYPHDLQVLNNHCGALKRYADCLLTEDFDEACKVYPKLLEERCNLMGKDMRYGAACISDFTSVLVALCEKMGFNTGLNNILTGGLSVIETNLSCKNITPEILSNSAAFLYQSFLFITHEDQDPHLITLSFKLLDVLQKNLDTSSNNYVFYYFFSKCLILASEYYKEKFMDDKAASAENKACELLSLLISKSNSKNPDYAFTLSAVLLDRYKENRDSSPEEAHEHLQTAQILMDNLSRDYPNNSVYLYISAIADIYLAKMLVGLGRNNNAPSLFKSALTKCRAAYSMNHSPEHARGLSNILNVVGEREFDSMHYQYTCELAKESLELLAPYKEIDSYHDWCLYDQTFALGRMINSLRLLNQDDKVLSIKDDFLSIAKECLHKYPNDLNVFYRYANVLKTIIQAYINTRDLPGALIIYGEIITPYRDITNRFPNNAVLQSTLGSSLVQRAVLYKVTNNQEKYYADLVEGISSLKTAVKNDPTNLSYSKLYINALEDFGEYLTKENRTQDAINNYLVEIDVRFRSANLISNETKADFLYETAKLHKKIADLYDTLGNDNSFMEHISSAVDILNQLLTESPNDSRYLTTIKQYNEIIKSKGVNIMNNLHTLDDENQTQDFSDDVTPDELIVFLVTNLIIEKYGEDIVNDNSFENLLYDVSTQFGEYIGERELAVVPSDKLDEFIALADAGADQAKIIEFFSKIGVDLEKLINDAMIKFHAKYLETTVFDSIHSTDYREAYFLGLLMVKYGADAEFDNDTYEKLMTDIDEQFSTKLIEKMIIAVPSDKLDELYSALESRKPYEFYGKMNIDLDELIIEAMNDFRKEYLS